MEKYLKKCIYNTLYSYIESNNIFSSCQSGFGKKIHVYRNFLPLLRKFLKIFMHVLLLKHVLSSFDISKAFDKVWHEGLLFKLESYGTKGPLMTLITSFLTDRFQRVVLK